MAGRRISYAGTLVGSCVFFLAYREWLSWFFLVGVLCLPWLSLLLSLPAMLTTRLTVRAPAEIPMGKMGKGGLAGSCKLPMPAVRGKLRITHAITGQVWNRKDGARLPTEHCGMLMVQPVRTRVCDYLGLFAVPVRFREPVSVLVLPKAVPVENPPDLTRYLANAWKPRPGGGFAENHELRLYRPGDSLHQIHWKLTAKTGKWILREPMEPLRGLAVLSMVLSGTPAELDEKLGKLLWLSRYLLTRELPHEIRCLTGSGVAHLPVSGEQDAKDAIRTLLSAPAGAGVLPTASDASWEYRIGGGTDEEG